MESLRQSSAKSKISIRSSGAQCRSIFLTLRDQIFLDNMWGWIPFRDAKAISGFSVVPKKDGITQRKLLMSCSFNYLLTPVEERSRLGMDAGGNINRLHTDGSSMCVAACDQSNAFTRVAVPSWFFPYQAVPPIVASLVWHLLPEQVRSAVTRSDLVCPVDMRLPMGCAHSVHILMQINIEILGRTIHHHPWLVSKAASDCFRFAW